MGFDTLPLEEFRELNGVTDDAEDCFVHFHDARVEFADILPQDRKEVAVKSAFRHVWDFVHPLTVIVYPALEEEWFLKIAREKVKQLSPTLIELPEKHMNELRWITRLDSGSLTGSYHCMLQGKADICSMAPTYVRGDCLRRYSFRQPCPLAQVAQVRLLPRA